ncbi:hypothetical protein COV19_00685 [Candidatus Woesearchaeota archaeon CG10_big_fil_rev_8_21_14_0_10_44_13]|nr:MAG: hypothetical protein COV19_00685 [Candidatus Woesearchaeota archaeon CG10_big_fil_rev_8_21_14_0_10_44_13]
MAELKEDLKKIKERDGELNFRANKTEEYLGLFSNVEVGKARELKEKLKKLDIPRLKEEHITKIVDIMPATSEEVKSILQGYTITVNNDNVKKIADAVAEFIPKKGKKTEKAEKAEKTEKAESAEKTEKAE